ncbi:MAG: hypothetical protein AAB263_01505 [Planctomycetota bacterium]
MRISTIIIGCLSVAVLAYGALSLWRRRAAPEPPISAAGGSAEIIPAIAGIPYWLQNDPAWSNEIISGSNDTMAAAGCLVSCVAMTLSSFDLHITPGELCRELNANHGFTAQGQLVWGAVTTCTKGAFMTAFPPLTHMAIDNELRGGRPVIAKIMLWGQVPHWVLMIGKQHTGYVMIDPLNTQRAVVPVSTRSTHIHAIRVLHRSGSQPTPTTPSLPTPSHP